MDFLAGQSRPLEARMLLTVLKAAKLRQDVTAQPGKGRGLWLSSKLWHSVTRYLEDQASQMEALNDDIKQKQEELDQLRMESEEERQQHQRTILELKAQVAHLKAEAANPLAELGALQAQMRVKQEAWDQHKHDLETQVHRLMVLMRSMGMFKDGEAGRAAASEPQSAAAEAMFESEVTAPDAQVLKIRELEILLADARRQLETCRRRLAARSLPNQELLEDNKRLKADNERLLALLSQVSQYRELAVEISAECGSHYLPLEECLMKRGIVQELYTPLKDRPMAGAAAPGASGSEDPPADPSGGANLVLDEQYHWVPREALQAGTALMRRLMPTLPTSQLMALVAELNKVWRDREHKRLAEVAASHQQELQHLRETFQQRAPYEAVVAGQKINDLKRRMRAQAAQAEAAAAVAKGDKRRVEDDSKVILQAGLSSIQDLSRQVARLEARNKKLAAKVARQARDLATAKAEPLCSCCINRLLSSKPTYEHICTQQPAEVPAPSLHTAPSTAPSTATTSAPQAANMAMLPSAARVDSIRQPSTMPSPSRHLPADARSSGSADHCSTSSLANGTQFLTVTDEPGQAWSAGTSMPPAAPQASKAAPLPEAAAAASGLSEEQGGPQTLSQPYAARSLVRINVFPTTAVSSSPRLDAPGPAQPAAGTARASFTDALAATLSSLSITAPGTTRMELGSSGDAKTGFSKTRVNGRPVATAGEANLEQPSAASLSEWRGGVPTGGSGGGLGVRVNVQAAPTSPLRDTAGCGQHRSAPVRVSVRFPRQDVGAV